MRDHLLPALLGIEVGNRWGLHEQMRRAIGWARRPASPRQAALHDLAAAPPASRRTPSLGGSADRREVELSYTLTAHDPASVRGEAAAGRAAGFRHFNYKVAVEPPTDLEVVAAVRDEVGPGPGAGRTPNLGGLGLMPRLPRAAADDGGRHAPDLSGAVAGAPAAWPQPGSRKVERTLAR